MPDRSVPEIILSQIWQDGWHARELRTLDGRRVSVVYRGVWTHSHGPDFRNALIEIDGTLFRGSVELHARASDWARHNHDTDPVYADVVLHVVLSDEGGVQARHVAAGEIPTVNLSSYLPAPIDTFRAQYPVADLGDIGTRTCLPALDVPREADVREILRREGWRRLVEKRLRFSQAMLTTPPGEVLYRGLLDGLGLVHNRVGMAAVAQRLPLVIVESIAERDGRLGVLAALLGVARFVPLAPAMQVYADLRPEDADAIESRYRGMIATLDLQEVPAGCWSLDRVRPANHPARRLAALASLLTSASPDGLLGAVLANATASGEQWRGWLRLARPTLGDARCAQIEVNVLAPFLAAYAEAVDDPALGELAARIWEQLPGAPDDSVAKATLRQIVGKRRFPVRRAIEVQGLHQIGRHGCAALRCFECPIAWLALELESR